MAKDFVFEREQLVQATMEQTWEFFSSPSNLSRITPKYMGFKILTELGHRAMFSGQQIDYTVKPLLGIAMRWRTEIRRVEKPKMFSDVQLKGPYAKWEHTHTFEQVGDKVLARDRVVFRLPFGIIGSIVGKPLVGYQLNKIFDYRAAQIDRIFPRK